MKTRKVANGIFAVFFTVMLLLTLFAEDLYCLTLPKVATETAVRMNFPYKSTGIDGQVYNIDRIALAVPKESLDGNRVIVLTETETGTFLEERVVKTGEENGDMIEITEGLRSKTKVVIGSDRTVSNGMQVIETKWDEQIALHEKREAGSESTAESAYLRECMKKNLWYMVGIAVLTAVLVIWCKKLLKRRLHVLQAPILILWCVLVCFFMREHIVIPGEWIPEKLIDWNGWMERVGRFGI